MKHPLIVGSAVAAGLLTVGGVFVASEPAAAAPSAGQFCSRSATTARDARGRILRCTIVNGKRRWVVAPVRPTPSASATSCAPRTVTVTITRAPVTVTTTRPAGGAAAGSPTS